MARHDQLDGTDFSAGMTAPRRDDLTVGDIRKTMDWRERHGGSWLAAARVVGCSEHAIRLACDPGYRPVHAAARPVVPPRSRTMTERTFHVVRNAALAVDDDEGDGEGDDA